MRKSVKKEKRVEPQISPAKRRLFTVIAVSIPVLFFVLFEIGLRLGNYAGDTTLFVPTPDKRSPYLGLNQNAGKRFFYRDTFLPSPRKDLFLRQKPENGYRIFVLGGSTAAGFPYGNNLTFSRVLQRRLVNAFPDRRIEVVNCAFTAINTYTLLDYMDEILDQQPDLILVYAGHNEFYGALGVSSMESLGRQRWFVKGYLKLQRLKIFIWVRNTINAVRSTLQKDDGHTFEDPTATVMSRIVKDKKIPYGSTIYKLGEKQFRGNMQDIIKRAQKKNVPVILSELVSNVRDHRPFVSIKSADYPAALEEYSTAQKAEKQSDFATAKEHYYNAKDYDALRFRASEDLNFIVHELAEKYKLPVVPMKKYFEDASPNGLIGENLMWEHLHPKSTGYFIMADAFFDAIRDNNHIIPNWSEKKYLPSRYYEKNWGLTRLDSVHAEMSVLQLKGSWPFAPAGKLNKFMTGFKPASIEEEIVFRILRDGDGTLEQGHIKLAVDYEKNKEYLKAFREYRALVYTVPTLDLFYQPLIQLLIKMQEHQLALRILHEAAHYQDTAFVYKWLGQIYLVLDETERGIYYLKEALKREPNDVQSVFNITRAYYKVGQFEQGDKHLNDLETQIAQSSEFKELKEFRLLMLAEHQEKNSIKKEIKNKPPISR